MVFQRLMFLVFLGSKWNRVKSEECKPVNMNQIKSSCECDGDTITECTTVMLQRYYSIYLTNLAASKISDNLIINGNFEAITISYCPNLEPQSISNLVSKYGNKIHELSLSHLFDNVDKGEGPLNVKGYTGPANYMQLTGLNNMSVHLPTNLRLMKQDSCQFQINHAEVGNTQVNFLVKEGASSNCAIMWGGMNVFPNIYSEMVNGKTYEPMAPLHVHFDAGSQYVLKENLFYYPEIMPLQKRWVVRVKVAYGVLTILLVIMLIRLNWKEDEVGVEMRQFTLQDDYLLLHKTLHEQQMQNDLLHLKTAMTLSQNLSPEEQQFISSEYWNQLDFQGDQYLNFLPNSEQGININDVNTQSSLIGQGDYQTTSVHPTCEKKKRIALVKTHKCASDLMAAILLRFAQCNDLDVLLPKVGGSNYLYPLIPRRLVNRHVTSRRKSALFEMMALHTMYDWEVWNSFMESPFALVGMVREPLSQFQSFFSYYGGAVRMHKMKPEVAENYTLDYLLEHPDENETSTLIRTMRLKNTMFFDFGGETNNRNSYEAGRYIDDLVQNFTMFLVQEKFDESLVVLKNKMCWNWADVAYKPANVGKYKHFDPNDKQRSEARQKLHKNFSPYDYMLYQKTFSKLNQDISEVSNFEEQLREFRNVNTQISNWCTANKQLRHRQNDERLVLHNRYEQTETSVITMELCRMLKIKMVPWVHKLLMETYNVNATAEWELRKAIFRARQVHNTTPKDIPGDDMDLEDKNSDSDGSIEVRNQNQLENKFLLTTQV